MSKSRIALFAAIAVLIYGFFAFDLGQYLSLDFFKSQQAAIDTYFQANPWQTALIFFGIYVAVTGLSLPGAAVMTLVAGAIFGLLWGTIIVSFASTLGATLAFLVSRFLLRNWVQTKFGDKLKAINQGVERDGAFYLFTLRLVPIFPFFVINLVMALTPIRTLTFAWVSQVGMLAGTLVYVNAGTQIAGIESLSGILSPGLLASFVLLGIFPLLAKKLVAFIKARQVLRGYPKPKRFDRNLVVIGAGSAGLVTAYIGAAVKAKVSLIEKHKMGGDCLNTGCVPSKALLRSAKFLSHIKRAEEFGFKSAQADFDFAEVMERVQRVIKTVEPHDSVERYTELGVDCILGEAKITSPYTVEVDGRTLTTRNIVIAAGARPFVPPIPGLQDVGYLTSDNVWDLRELPRRLVVLGGGPIGCELAQAFARFGTQVSQVEMLPRIMIREDPEISALVTERFQAEGIQVLTEHKAKQVIQEGDQKVLICENQGQDVRIEFDHILVAVGRAANTAGYGLEELGVPVSKTRTVEVNEYLQTRFPNIYAVGDVAGPFQFTHTAAHQAWFAAVNALFGGFKKFKADYSVIPWATFIEPEVARVGLNEQDAKEQGVAFEVTRYDIDDLDRAIADSEAHGFVKVLTVPGKDKILGVTIVGEHAGDLIAEYVAAMRHGFGLNKILSTIHIYPTLAEANKYAAGVWKKAHAPQGTLRWLERFHAWMRRDSGQVSSSSLPTPVNEKG
ncbi:MAG: dihydrolipoyl dehydrogenase [Candidatus Competibacteraceae bacterium]|nr:dihydrolipoyl dehydrogenase [Candidatus Competibacteraceae bacterium]